MSNGNSIVSILEAGLRANAVRGRVTANNVANVDTPGFKRSAVRFEEVLADRLKSGQELDVKDLVSEVFRPLDTPARRDGNDVSMDMEIGDMIKNGARHKAYIRLLAKRYRQMDQAMQIG